MLFIIAKIFASRKGLRRKSSQPTFFTTTRSSSKALAVTAMMAVVALWWWLWFVWSRRSRPSWAFAYPSKWGNEVRLKDFPECDRPKACALGAIASWPLQASLSSKPRRLSSLINCSSSLLSWEWALTSIFEQSNSSTNKRVDRWILQIGIFLPTLFTFLYSLQAS